MKMKKLIYIFSFVILLFPIITFASELTCEYDKVIWNVSPEVYIKLKIEINKIETNENDSKYSIKKFAWANDKYIEYTDTSDFYDFFLTKDDEKSTNVEVFDNIKAEDFYNIYKNVKECPKIATLTGELAKASSTGYFIKAVEDESYSSLSGAAVSSGKNITTQNSQDNSVDSNDTENDSEPIKVLNVCKYELPSKRLTEDNGAFNSQRIYFEFYMKSNGKKYWKAGVSQENLVEQLIDGYADNNIIIKDKKNRDYVIILPKGEIENILVQKNWSDFEYNQYQCLNSSKLGVNQNGAGNSLEFFITTDEKLLEDDSSVNLTDPSDDSTNDNIHIDVDKADCSSLLGKTKTPKTPAWYMMIVFNVMKYVAIVLLITLTIMDYVGAITSQDNDQIKKVTQKTIKRAILCVAIFILPTLIEFVLQFIDKATTTCEIGG